MHTHKYSICLILSLIGICLFSTGCADIELHPDDVEYRIDDNGTELLFQIGREYPFAYGERAFIVDHYKNKKIKFKVEFQNGKKDGNFTFWQENGLRKLTGGFNQGKRNGLFTAYGKIGELVYQKKYTNGELDGIFKLYFPCSNGEVSRYYEELKKKKSENDGIFKKLVSWAKGDLNPDQLPVTDNLRLDAIFSDGKPDGRYQIFYHPKGKTHNLNELLKEQGHFKDGKLLKDQVHYYPRTSAIAVILPDNKRLDQIYPPTPDGFSRAIDDANKEYNKIPSYRNPENLPAWVYTIDDRGGKIAPIWTSHIAQIGLVKSNGLRTRINNIEYKANYEEFIKAKNYATENFSFGDDINFSEQVARDKNVLEIVGFDKKGNVVDILWSSNELSESIPLHERIEHRRIKIKRKWSEDLTHEAIWSLTNGSKIRIKDKGFSFRSTTDADQN